MPLSYTVPLYLHVSWIEFKQQTHQIESCLAFWELRPKVVGKLLLVCSPLWCLISGVSYVDQDRQLVFLCGQNTSCPHSILKST